MVADPTRTWKEGPLWVRMTACDEIKSEGLVEIKEFGGTCPAIVVHVADLPLTFNQRVVGSIPTALTNNNKEL